MNLGSLTGLFGTRIETRFVATISLVVTIALVSLSIIVSAEIRQLVSELTSERVAFLARLARRAYPEPAFSSASFPEEFLALWVGPKGEPGVWLLAREWEGQSELKERIQKAPDESFLEDPSGYVYVLEGARGGATPELEVRVVVSVDRIRSLTMRPIGTLLAVGVAILISSYFLGVFLANLMLVPLRKFSKSILEMVRGDLGPTLMQKAPEEFGQFSRAFDLLLDQIRKNQELERSLMAREKMASIGQMAAGIAHETRNPLAAISSLTQMIGSEVKEDPRLRKYTQVILKEVKRLDRNVSQLLDFARPVPTHLRAIPVQEVTEDAIVLLGFEGRKQGVRIERCFAEETPETWVLDADQFKQMLVNLMTNAISMSPVGGKVWVGLEAMDQTLLVWVEDSGPGVEEKLREKIFQPFFTARAGGTGLGLAVVRRVVEMHRGRIWVEEGKFPLELEPGDPRTFAEGPEGAREDLDPSPSPETGATEESASKAKDPPSFGARFVVQFPRSQESGPIRSDPPQGPGPWPQRRNRDDS